MKRVPRLASEPASLAAYRANNPGPGAASTAIWNRFRDDAAYRDVREQLLVRQRGLCGYCEQRVTSEAGVLNANDQQIEHVLPKAGGASRALDWTNLLLCCGGGAYPHHSDPTRYAAGKDNISCGQFKGERHLGPGCDPRGFPYDPRLVSVGLDGELTAHVDACRAVGINPQELQRTINEVLNLNCARLKLARSKIVANILEWVVPVLQELLRGTYAQPQQARQFAVDFAGLRLQPDSHGQLRAFWTSERQYLEPWSSDWLSQNAQLLG